MLIGPRLEYLAPYWGAILAEHGLVVGYHVALALATIAAVIYAVARAVGLADLGNRVDLAERSTRRNEGDAGLGDALKRETEGKWE